MKKYLIIAMVLFSCKGEKNHRRYFFIGYAAPDNISGNFYMGSDSLPNVDSLRNYIWKSNECEYNWGYDENSYIINGLYEFKDSTESAHFRNGRNEPLKKCVWIGEGLKYDISNIHWGTAKDFSTTK